MKKRFFGAVVVAIAVGSMINVNLNKVGNKDGNIALANVEALAQAEADNHYWEEMYITPLYNHTGSLHVSYQGVSIELASASSGLCGYWKNCEFALFSTCDRNDQGYENLN